MLRAPHLVTAALTITMATGEAFFGVSSARADPAPSQAEIMASLTPYGDWVVVSQWGRVWAPRGLPRGWRPYTYGHWTVQNDVWTWNSDWNWGWAAFHYGRWTYDVRYGWVWVPGDVYAPAWVVWRDTGGHVGWAPAPPGYLTFGMGVVAGLPLSYWCFVDRRYIGRRGLRRRLVPSYALPRYYRRSRIRTVPAAPAHKVARAPRARPAPSPTPARAVPSRAVPARAPTRAIGTPSSSSGRARAARSAGSRGGSTRTARSAGSRGGSTRTARPADSRGGSTRTARPARKSSNFSTYGARNTGSRVTARPSSSRRSSYRSVSSRRGFRGSSGRGRPARRPR